VAGSARGQERRRSHHRFDASAFACQIAAEVRNFDPFQFIEKKEVKKMGRFIHFAIAAADEAMKMSQAERSRPKTPRTSACTSAPASADST
jgi:3-oxoacyl-(acyl-carrier-protein) synthase